MSIHPGEIARPIHAQQTSPVGGGSKRAFDIVVAFVSLLLLLPLFLLVAAAIKATDGGEVLFRHPRIGYAGQVFNCYKFRTMSENGAETLNAYLASHPNARREWERDQKLKDDPRVTVLGRLLRQSSMDELPQLLNVLSGEMSLVGPRPVTLNELDERYGVHAAIYLSIRPGITGLWQVSGRNDLCYDHRVQLDCSYVRTWSLWMDFVTLVKTVPAIVNGRGCY